jgi:hypothetical protein
MSLMFNGMKIIFEKTVMMVCMKNKNIVKCFEGKYNFFLPNEFCNIFTIENHEGGKGRGKSLKRQF